MKLGEYAQLVKEMRAAQKEFFRTPRDDEARRRDTVSRSKELERRVDRATEDILDTQAKMF